MEDYLFFPSEKPCLDGDQKKFRIYFYLKNWLSSFWGILNFTQFYYNNYSLLSTGHEAMTIFFLIPFPLWVWVCCTIMSSFELWERVEIFLLYSIRTRDGHEKKDAGLWFVRLWTMNQHKRFSFMNHFVAHGSHPLPPDPTSVSCCEAAQAQIMRLFTNHKAALFIMNFDLCCGLLLSNSPFWPERIL